MLSGPGKQPRHFPGQYPGKYRSYRAQLCPAAGTTPWAWR